MNVHFVCTGNVYRSRLAEAYLNSKQLPNIEATSSGTLAAINYDFHGPIYWGAMRLIERYHLAPFMSPMSTQTTLELLHSADLIIFMKRNHHEFSKKHIGFLKENFEVWNIPDLEDVPEYYSGTDAEMLDATERTFTLIRKEVDELAKNFRIKTLKLTLAELVDQ